MASDADVRDNLPLIELLLKHGAAPRVLVLVYTPDPFSSHRYDRRWCWPTFQCGIDWEESMQKHLEERKAMKWIFESAASERHRAEGAP